VLIGIIAMWAVAIKGDTFVPGYRQFRYIVFKLKRFLMGVLHH
jgi:hypothetical protein